ncbi:hypothetical protein Vadar_001210 [Vaccinium darrowii]|uniref:Uncharacterized protein n=1 Tax=Vaccinium darrowii TaxID=229202 RepID=A0ACB7XMB6_9ERIC|nr:hypothetical protein Vadar_001210 [Vaccinium darrowii]
MQLNKDFKPLFKLLETQPDPTGKDLSSCGLHNFIRSMNVDIGQIQMHEDDANLSLIDFGKLLSLSPNAAGANQTSRQGILSKLTLEGSMLGSGNLPSSLSSIVDEGMIQAIPVSSPSSGPTRGAYLKKIFASNSDLDLSSIRSTHSTDSSSTMDKDQLHASGNRSSLLLSPPRLISSQVSAPILKSIGPINSTTATVDGSFKVSGSSSWAKTTESERPDVAVSPSSSLYAVKRSRKRTVSDMLNLIPSLLEDYSGFSSRRKLAESGFKQQISPYPLFSSEIVGRPEGRIAEANKGNAPSRIYMYQHFFIGDTWQHICLGLGRPGSMCWDVKINDQHFKDLWNFRMGAILLHGALKFVLPILLTWILTCYDPEGVVLSYHSVKPDSIKTLLADVERLYNARMFALGMRKLLGFLEDFINGAEVASLLDCICLTAGPLHALARATRLAGAGPASVVPGVASSISAVRKPSGYPEHQSHLQSSSSINGSQATTAIGGNPITSTAAASLGNHNLHGSVMLAAAAWGVPSIVPSSLLPIDVSAVLRGPNWISEMHRKYFAVDMRCFAGDHVWLQPATTPKGGPSAELLGCPTASL